jgi:hypothetical protein
LRYLHKNTVKLPKTYALEFLIGMAKDSIITEKYHNLLTCLTNKPPCFQLLVGIPFIFTCQFHYKLRQILKAFLKKLINSVTLQN